MHCKTWRRQVTPKLAGRHLAVVQEGVLALHDAAIRYPARVLVQHHEVPVDRFHGIAHELIWQAPDEVMALHQHPRLDVRRENPLADALELFELLQVGEVELHMCYIGLHAQQVESAPNGQSRQPEKVVELLSGFPLVGQYAHKSRAEERRLMQLLSQALVQDNALVEESAILTDDLGFAVAGQAFEALRAADQGAIGDVWVSERR
mmetsp:Transcript_6073/g.17295  ORF Transcript_6073/g.17295 Transcript_6073/m.17295 type:complete len:206 (+) Transcript_6073:1258-1875(+)